MDNGNPVKLRILLDASFQEVKRLFVLAFDNYDNGANIVIIANNYQLIAVDLSKHDELDADPRAIQQTEFYGTLNTKSDVCTILEKT